MGVKVVKKAVDFPDRNPETTPFRVWFYQMPFLADPRFLSQARIFQFIDHISFLSGRPARG